MPNTLPFLIRHGYIPHMDSTIHPTNASPLPNRRSLRLHGYDYATPAGYFVTLCTHRRACLFGTISNDALQESACAQIVREEWFHTAALRPYLRLLSNEFVLMPNHVHGILWITDRSEPRQVRQESVAGNIPHGPRSGSIGAIIAGFKSATTKRINHERGTSGVPLWQRNYYEHVIRDGESLDRIRRYITGNPACWQSDPDNPDASAPEPEDAWRL